jgi:hypothetical protein
MWESRRLTTLWAFTACYRNSFTFYFIDFTTGHDSAFGSIAAAVRRWLLMAQPRVQSPVLSCETYSTGDDIDDVFLRDFDLPLLSPIPLLLCAHVP